MSAESYEAGQSTGLAEFLRYCRESRRPEDFGLPSDTRRRVRGLRREEVAVLAHISSTWLTQLEQGRLGHRPTVEVLDAIATGLRLTRDEHDHLRSLGGYPATTTLVDNPTVPSQIDLLVQSLAYPASVTTPWFDYVAWNSPFVSLVGVDPGELSPRWRNSLYVWFGMEKCSKGLQGWEPIKEALIARLRFELAEYGEHPRFKQLLADVCALSEPFRTAWDQHQVRRSMYVGGMVLDRPPVGSIAVHLVRLTVQDNPHLRLGVYVPASPEDAQKLDALPPWNSADDHDVTASIKQLESMEADPSNSE